MKGTIIYRGKYGATEQYAQWLSVALKLPMSTSEAVTPGLLANNDYIVLGSSVYAGKLVISSWLKANQVQLAGKKIFLFIVCGTTADNVYLQQVVVANNIELEIRNNCEFFFVPGRVIVSGLNWKDRFVLKMGAMMQKDPEKKAAMLRGFDRMDKKHLNGLIKRIGNYRTPQFATDAFGRSL